MNTNELWESACSHLKGILNADIYDLWIMNNIVLGDLQDNTLVLNVDNLFCQTWVEKNFSEMIVNALVAAGAPEDIKLSIEIVERELEIEEEPKKIEHLGSTPFAPTPAPRKKSKIKNNFTGIPLNPDFTFENFVTGPSNEFAYAAALGVCQSPGQAYNPLFIYGQTGIGKTHLMQAIGHKMLESGKYRVCFVTSETLLNEYLEAITNRTTVDFRNRYRRADLLLVDDIQFLANKERIQEEFFHTFNALVEARKHIIMTSDLPPRELKGLEPRLVSRFERGLVTEIESPDFETRLAILKYKHSLNDITLSDDILTFIASNIKSNIRSLEGALTRVISFAKLQHSNNFSIDSLKMLLKDQLSEENLKDLTLEEIQRVVVDYYDLRMADMSSTDRSRSLAGPRQIAMFLCRKLTPASLMEIAGSFSKDHSTVSHACKAIQERLTVDDSLRSDIRAITIKLNRDPKVLNLF